MKVSSKFEADLVLMLYSSKINSSNQKRKSQITELIIAKQRNGPTGTIQFKFNEKYTKFTELDVS